ncbi:MAG: hypothetical protein U1E53_12410 [Dongiaceae bacterium]
MAEAAASSVGEAAAEGGGATAAAAGAIGRELASHPAGLAVAGLLVSFVLGYFVGAHRRALAGLPPRRR